MSTVYTPSPVKLGTITLIADGDPKNSSGVNTPIEGVADGVKFLNARTDSLADLATLTAIAAPANGDVWHVLGFGWYVFQTTATTGLSPFRLAADDLTPGGWVSSTAHETTRTVRVSCSKVLGISSNTTGTPTAIAPSLRPWAVPMTGTQCNRKDSAGFNTALVSNSATLSYGYVIPLDDDLVDGATLVSATVHLYPAAGRSALPSSQPKIAVTRQLRSGDAVATPDSLLSTTYAQLAAANVAAYETNNDIVLTADQNNTIDLTTYSYQLIIWDEHDSNAAHISNVTRYSYVELSLSGISDARRS